MVGLLDLANQKGGQADLLKTIAKLGYNDTPFFNAVTKAVPDSSSKTLGGHQWRYEESPDGDDDNAHVEGSAPASAVSRDLGESLNHYQIIKHTYGVTGSMDGKTSTDGSNELNNEGASAIIRHRKTIEKAIFSTQAPVQGVRADGTAGKMGGLHHWCTVENTIDTAGDMSMKLLRELFKIGHLNGVDATYLYVSDIQKDILDEIFESKIMTSVGATKLEGTNYTSIANMAYAPNVKIIMSPYVADDEAIAVNMSNIALVNHRLTKTHELARTADEVTKEIITELTMRVNNPFAVAKLSGLTV